MLLRYCPLICCLLAVSAQASPPVLNIASEPLAAACGGIKSGAGDSASLADGPSLLRASAMPAAASPAGSAGELFQATMNMSDWSGHFRRYALSAADGLSGASDLPPAVWDAGDLLTGAPGRAPTPSPAARNIHTAIVQADGSLAPAPFAWEALSAAQRALLDQAPPSASGKAVADGLGRQRLAWLRGDRTLEGTLLRRRGSVLGDAVNSKPVYVGAPSGGHAGADYLAYFRAHQARRPVVYLGANDGMLHAFDVASGLELYAYVPDALMATLNRLPDPAPAYAHRAYVDGPAGAGEALVDSHWKSVLVSGMGGGAQGVFALDVSDPERLAEDGALWEFTDRDDPMMGNVTTAPQIAMVRTGASGGVASYRHVAVVASGLNNYASDGHVTSAGKGALFLLALDKPRGAAWQLNVNYYRLITPIADPSLANALSAPALVAGQDGALRYAYAGDLQGNLWRFDFSGKAPWGDAVGPGAGKTPLFVARDGAGKRQPIAQQPLIALAADGGYLLLFGTGRFIETADRSAASDAPQSYYAIHDSLATPAVVVAGRRELTERVLGGGSGDTLLSITGPAIDPGSKGWYVDFLRSAETGERSIAAGVLEGGQIVFSTLLPGAGACAAARSRVYALNVLSGLAGDSVTTAVPPAAPADYPVVGLLRMDFIAQAALLPVTLTRTSPDPAGRVRVRRELALASLGSGGAARIGTLRHTRRAGRLSWREVANWRELHKTTKP